MTIRTNGIKLSKKYGNGTIHENGSGKFQILDRYNDNNIIMLKYQWLETGVIETNKEANVNASIWKFQKVRGLVGNTKKLDTISAVKLDELDSKLDKLMEINEIQANLLEENSEVLRIQQLTIEEQNIRINRLMEKLIEKL